jgi:hypothetical protein
MQNEATNAIQERLIKNPHLAASLRRGLLQTRGKAKQGYEPTDRFVRILNSLTDEQLVSKYIAHSIHQRILTVTS